MIEPMNEIPLWVAVVIAFFLLAGAFFTLVGAVGFLRLPTFYERIHAPTLGTSVGVGGVAIASMIFFSVTASQLVLHEILLAIFATVTTPATLMLLARAALHRDRAEKNGNVPPKHEEDA